MTGSSRNNSAFNQVEVEAEAVLGVMVKIVATNAVVSQLQWRGTDRNTNISQETFFSLDPMQTRQLCWRLTMFLGNINISFG